MIRSLLPAAVVLARDDAGARHPRSGAQVHQAHGTASLPHRRGLAADRQDEAAALERATRDFVVPINAAGRGAIAGNPDLQVLVHDHDEGFLTPLRTA